MNRSEILRETLSTLRRHGFEPRVEQSKHFKVRWHDRAGRPRLVVISRSPSDRNTIHAARATLRRLLREPAGIDRRFFDTTNQFGPAEE